MEEDQEKHLDDARKVVKEQAYFMKASLEKAQLRDALKYSAAMLSELRTSLLTPRNYYILFMQIFDEMRTLETYFKEEYRRGRKMPDLYESVQHAPFVIPRLYLLITVGSVYIQTHEIGSKVILADLIESIKSVQHPLRGLFLRYYFLKLCKDRLPDSGSEYEGEGGNVDDAVDVIVKNLTEMNKLWIRMQGNKEKSRRERERLDLKVVIGENVTRLSNLEGVNLELYKTKVLPKLIELVVACKDPISQGYLIDCIIQAFPDEFHLNTLEDILKVSTTQLEPNVDVKNIFINLMDRLADYALNNDAVSNFNQEIDIYNLFKSNIDKILENSGSIEFKNLLDLQVAFLNFSLRCYPQNAENVNSVLKSCCRLCTKMNESDFNEDCQKNIVKLLTMPLETMGLTILTMNEYPNLMQYLPFVKRRQVAVKICQAVVNLNQYLSDVTITQQLLKFIQPLLVTGSDYQEISEQEFDEEQCLVTRTIHLVSHNDPIVLNQLLQMFITFFMKGEIKRQKHSLPAACFALFRLIRFLEQTQFQSCKYLKYINLYKKEDLNYGLLFNQIKSLIEILQGTFPQMSINLYLMLILCINEVDQSLQFDDFTYDLGAQAISLFQEELSDAAIKFQVIHQIIAAFSRINCVSQENHDTLCGNACSQAAKLLKKNEQCIAVINSTHMFYYQGAIVEQRISECFKRALKNAQTCIQSSPKMIGIYIILLNKYIYYIDQLQFKDQDVQNCVDTIQKNIQAATVDNDEISRKILTYWKNTSNYIKERRQTDGGFLPKLSI